jgi:acetoin utilization protein AcuB
MTNREWMKQPVHVVKPRDSIWHARELLERHRINQLPVVLDGRVIGIVTDRDLRDAFPSIFDALPGARRRRRATGTDPKAVPVEDVMSRDVIVLSPQDTVDQAARVMRRQRIGAVPIVENERLVGIVTRSDVLDAYAELYARMPEAMKTSPPAESAC